MSTKKESTFSGFELDTKFGSTFKNKFIIRQSLKISVCPDNDIINVNDKPLVEKVGKH